MGKLVSLMQILGAAFGITLLFIGFGIRSWPVATIGAALITVHFAGDIVSQFMKPPLIVGNYNLSEIFVAPPNLLIMAGTDMIFASTLFSMCGHRSLSLVTLFFGVALFITGFGWAPLYGKYDG